MIINDKIVLASRSPRRLSLLKMICTNISVIAPDIEENLSSKFKARDAVELLAANKMDAVMQNLTDEICVTADTIVVFNDMILGKPFDKNDAFKILKLLSGNRHFVYTGFCVYNAATRNKIISSEKTEVRFRELEDSEIEAYLNTGSPYDKAGAYGIQDSFGSVFISGIEGDYYNVVGLPLYRIYSSIKSVRSEDDEI
ncbi:MAG: septum formation protein Maf [Ignavibacteriaceae bacterium]|nr:Maf family protein [Ignavibacteriaceae bacterium]NUM71445.1 septum formation protein Maf [Ignavibacteriaceae bacterium]